MAKGTLKDEHNSDDEEDLETQNKRSDARESEDDRKSISEDDIESRVIEELSNKHTRKLKHSRSDEEEEEEEDADDNAKESESVDKNRRESEGADFVELEILDDADEVDSKRTKRQANTYAAKKTVAQGMMDIALITANANQLRYLIEFNRHSSTFYVNVILIVLSLILQVGVGISLIFKGRMDLRGQSKHRHAKRINNYVVVGVFLVTLINVFVASFTVTGPAAQGGVPTNS